LPFARLEAGTFGFQLAAWATAFMTPIQRALPFSAVASMFSVRKAIGSMFAAWARASIICSAANSDCGAAGARSQIPFGKPLYPSTRLLVTRRFGRL